MGLQRKSNAFALKHLCEDGPGEAANREERGRNQRPTRDPGGGRGGGGCDGFSGSEGPALHGMKILSAYHQQQAADALARPSDPPEHV